MFCAAWVGRQYGNGAGIGMVFLGQLCAFAAVAPGMEETCLSSLVRLGTPGQREHLHCILGGGMMGCAWLCGCPLSLVTHRGQWAEG